LRGVRLLALVGGRAAVCSRLRRARCHGGGLRGCSAGLRRRGCHRVGRGAAPVTDRLIRVTTALAVVAVAGVAAIISYQHAYELVRSHGEAGLTARGTTFRQGRWHDQVIGATARSCGYAPAAMIGYSRTPQHCGQLSAGLLTPPRWPHLAKPGQSLTPGLGEHPRNVAPAVAKPGSGGLGRPPPANGKTATASSSPATSGKWLSCGPRSRCMSEPWIAPSASWARWRGWTLTPASPGSARLRAG
jgi:hypothetical protein